MNRTDAGEHDWDFTPAAFVELLDKERKWFALLATFIQSRATHPSGIETTAVEWMLRDRARVLRN